MFLLKYLFLKLKQVPVYARRVKLNHVVFSACFSALLLWFCGSSTDPSNVPEHLSKYLQFPEDYKIPEKQLTDTELTELTLKVEQLNAHIEVINWSKYDPINSETTIIVIRVHKDVERLQYLIISLAQVRYIHQVLLIFSHSYYDDIINSLVKSIEFCKVVQIFYPFSLQLNPNKFPGIDPDDCNVTVRPKRGKPAGSTPGEPPCFERDARRTEQKQHWWWTANYVFEGLEWSSNKQVVMFLEEDNYVFPDLLHMLQYARRVLTHFPTVDVMSFGRLHAKGLDYDLFTIDSWTPPYDKGLAFNRTTWRKISERASLYCFYDDCSWSYSLVHLFGNLSGGAAEMAACSAPRVLGTGALGVGARGGGARGGARRAARWARAAALFPRAPRAALTAGARGRLRRRWRAPPAGNGGWADLRDQLLCLDPLMTTTTDRTTETTQRFDWAIKNVSIAI